MTEAKARRLASLDIARGLALLAMFAFHFLWDLGHFGYIDAEFPLSPSVRAFGHAIAIAFLFIAGISLVLAHGDRPHWPRFWRRFAIVAAAAALVSAATYLLDPDAFIFFGILHCIAAASLLSAPFLFLPWGGSLAVAALVAAAPLVAANSFFDAWPWWWTGLSTFEPSSNDYRPLLPWLGAMLAGVAAAKAFRAHPSLDHAAFRRNRPNAENVVDSNSIERAQREKPVPAFSQRALAPLSVGANGSRRLEWLGQRSLPIYLAHQPALFAAFGALALFAQPIQSASTFAGACEAQCMAKGADAEMCRKTCACTQEEFARQSASSGGFSDEERWRRIKSVALECVAKIHNAN
jgi:uncharacterized membrane protein